MRKTLITFLLSVMVATIATSQTADTTKLWTNGFKASLTFNQVSLTNWAAGGENSLGANSFLNLFANLKQGKTTWDNSLDLAYGMVKLGDANVRKSDDKIDLVSKLGHNVINKNLFLSANLSFKTQFAEGYNYPDDSGNHFKVYGSRLCHAWFRYGIQTLPIPVNITPATDRQVNYCKRHLPFSGLWA